MRRNILELVKEGQEKTLEQVALVEKQMNGTITPDESVRLSMLTGNLLALMKEAQAQGFGVTPTATDEDDLDGLGDDDHLNDDGYVDESQDSLWADEEDDSPTDFRFY